MPVVRRFYFGFCFALFLVAAPGSWAAIGFQPISPDELKMTSDPHAPGAPAIILFRQVDRDDNGRTSHEDNYFRIKILTEEGRRYADVEIPFYKSEGNITAIRARTIRPDGSIASFDGKVFEKFVVKARASSISPRPSPSLTSRGVALSNISTPSIYGIILFTTRIGF